MVLEQLSFLVLVQHIAVYRGATGHLQLFVWHVSGDTRIVRQFEIFTGLVIAVDVAFDNRIRHADVAVDLTLLTDDQH